jgi:N-formylglutamate amidohydrolase
MGRQMALHPPFTLYNTDDLLWPVLLSVPHAGRDYPAALLDALRVPLNSLLRLEDRYADRLVQPAIAAGFSAIVAHRARAWVDLNRAETDFDAGMFHRSNMPEAMPSAKTRGGLGLIPRRLSSVGELWRTHFDALHYHERIEQCHRPYHASVRSILAAMHRKFGVAILLDLHSMPSMTGAVAANLPPAVFVVGDRFGRTAASLYTESVIAPLQNAGFPVALNTPYPGDYILDAHGRPASNIHALQLEVDRSLYLDSDWREPSAQLGSVATLVTTVATSLADQACGLGFAEAAE